MADLANSGETDDDERVRKALGAACHMLRSADPYSISLLKLIHCDGGSGYGVAFTSSSVQVQYVVSSDGLVPVFAFTEIFATGYDMLLSYIKVGEKPKDQEKLRVFEKLTAFLSNIKDAEAGLQTKGEKQISENDWKARVAVHLLSKLLLGEDYRLDSCCRKKLTKCPCPCKATLKYGVTSIGNPRTYYGNLDVIIGTFRGAVAACEVREAEDEDEDVTTSDASNEEVKISPLNAHLSQLQSQAIVFSFFQQKDNPTLTFVPTVGVSKTHIQFHFYDSQKDIYLLSCEMPLFDIPMEEEQQLNLTTILAIWLVMNYSYLMTGSTSEMEQDDQFGFHTSCKPTILHRYKNDIRMGPLTSEPFKFQDNILSGRVKYLKRSKVSEDIEGKYAMY